MRLALIVSRVRVEEKLLLEAFEKRGLKPEIVSDDDLVLDPVDLDPRWREYSVVVERSVSTTRGLYTLRVLNAWGVKTVNSFETAATCADKLWTTLALARNGVPQPAARLAFSAEAGMEAIEQIGYPAVLKPVFGSWGRLLAKVGEPEAAEAILEHRHTLGSYPYHVNYVQPFVEKRLGRDIRAFVIGGRTACAIYRTSPHWITNTARGGVASNCPVTPELEDVCRRASEAVGGGVLAIDLFETDSGLMVNEVNHSMEFRNSIAPTGTDIPGLMVDYVLQVAETEPVAMAL